MFLTLMCSSVGLESSFIQYFLRPKMIVLISNFGEIKARSPLSV